MHSYAVMLVFVYILRFNIQYMYFRPDETVLATDPTGDRRAGMRQGVRVRRWEAIEVVALLCQEEIYGQIAVWPWAVMKLISYVMQLLILCISRPKLHLNPIHCFCIVGHNNKSR
jgi:hypothetical protein